MEELMTLSHPLQLNPIKSSPASSVSNIFVESIIKHIFSLSISNLLPDDADDDDEDDASSNNNEDDDDEDNEKGKPRSNIEEQI